MRLQGCKVIGLFLVCIFFIVGCGHHVDTVSTANYKNKELEFYCYIPKKLLADKTKKYPVLVCIPGLDGKGTDYEDSLFQDFAEKEGFILIAPSFNFDENNWDSQTSYQYPNAWSGAALLSIVHKVENTSGLHAGKLYLHGFSAGAQFALRFGVWDSSACSAVAAHAAGGMVVPQQFIPVKYFVTVGEQDTDRIPLTRENYRRLHNCGIDAVYKTYGGGHELPADQVRDSLKFFKATRAQRGE